MKTVLILAAGMGSRYGGLKQLDPMGPNGETILDYSIEDAIKAGFTKVVFVIRKAFGAEFQAHIEQRHLDTIKIHYAYQELNALPAGFECPPERTKPWGTAHAIWITRKLIQEPFAVINADDYYGPQAFHIASDHLDHALSNESSYGMVAYQLDNTLSPHGGVNRGILHHTNHEMDDVREILDIRTQSDGTLSGFKNDGTLALLRPDTLVSMNFFLFTPTLFTHLESFLRDFFTHRLEEKKSESFIPAVVDHLLKTKQAVCKIHTTEDKWFGITYPEDKTIVQHALLQIRPKRS